MTSVVWCIFPSVFLPPVLNEEPSDAVYNIRFHGWQLPIQIRHHLHKQSHTHTKHTQTFTCTKNTQTITHTNIHAQKTHKQSHTQNTQTHTHIHACSILDHPTWELMPARPDRNNFRTVTELVHNARVRQNALGYTRKESSNKIHFQTKRHSDANNYRTRSAHTLVFRNEAGARRKAKKASIQQRSAWEKNYLIISGTNSRL